MSRLRTAGGYLCAANDGWVIPCDCDEGCCKCGRTCDFSTLEISSVVIPTFPCVYEIHRPREYTTIAYRFDFAIRGYQSSAGDTYRHGKCDARNIRIIRYLGRAFDTIGDYPVPPRIDNPTQAPIPDAPFDPGELPQLPETTSVGADVVQLIRMNRNEALRSWTIELAIGFAVNLPGFEAYLVVKIDPDTPLIEDRCGVFAEGPIGGTTASLRVGASVFTDIPVTVTSDGNGRLSVSIGGGGERVYQALAVDGRYPFPLVFRLSNAFTVRIDTINHATECPPTAVPTDAVCCVDAPPSRCVFGRCEGLSSARVSVDWLWELRPKAGDYLVWPNPQRESIGISATVQAESCNVARATGNQLERSIQATYSGRGYVNNPALVIPVTSAPGSTSDEIVVGLLNDGIITVTALMKKLDFSYIGTYNPDILLQISLAPNGTVGLSLDGDSPCFRRRPYCVRNDPASTIFLSLSDALPTTPTLAGLLATSEEWITALAHPRQGDGCRAVTGYQFNNPQYSASVIGFSRIRCDSGTAYGEITIRESLNRITVPVPQSVTGYFPGQNVTLAGYDLVATARVSVAGLSSCGTSPPASGSLAAFGCPGCGRKPEEIGALIL